MTQTRWTIIYAKVGSRGTTYYRTVHAVSRREAFRKALAMLAEDRRRTGGIELTITKGDRNAL